MAVVVCSRKRANYSRMLQMNAATGGFRVCAIDAGTRNLAWCVITSADPRAPLQWHRVDIWGSTKKPKIEDIVRVTRKWALENYDTIDSCHSIVVERQMRPVFIVMNAVLHTLFFGKVREVHPQTVGAFWNLPKRRVEKKARGIEVVRECGLQFPTNGKQDDLADAWLMAAHELVRLRGAKASDFMQ